MSLLTDRPRQIFTESHNSFRDQVRRFIADKVVPHHAEWEKAGRVSREVWQEAGRMGLLCCTVPEEYGGSGADFLYSIIVLEELAYAHSPGPGFAIHSEMAVPYLVNFGSEEQKQKWLPPLCRGDLIAGVAMSEPGAGSDLQNMQTRARRTEDGYVISGQKVFISNGQIADVFIVAARQDDQSRALSLFLVPSDSVGFTRGRNLSKIGNHAQDTSELFFNDVRIPKENLIGEEGAGFKYLTHGLARERLTICTGSQARAESVLRDTVAYVAERSLFGKTLSDMQNTRFSLASVQADILAGRALVDDLLAQNAAGRLDMATSAAGKLWITEMLGRVVDACLQLHGGWGYMTEYSVARAYVDARVTRIAGGGSEVMKEIIARSLWPRK